MDLPPELEPATGLSPSSLDLWLQCPRKYRKEKLERRVGSPSGVDAVLGSYVHRVLEVLMTLAPSERTAENAKVLMKSCWGEVVQSTDWTALALTPDEATSFRRKAWGSVRNYFEIEDPTKVDVVATERRIDAVIDGVPMRGIIDRLETDVFDDLVVTDYKSGKVPAPHFRGPKLRQLNIYAALVEADPTPGPMQGKLPTEGRLVFTSFGKVITTSIDQETVGEAVAVVVDAWEDIGLAIASDEFAPQPGPLCGWCPFAAECPEGLEDLRDRRAKGKLRVDAPAYPLAAPLPEPVEATAVRL